MNFKIQGQEKTTPVKEELINQNLKKAKSFADVKEMPIVSR